MPIGNERLDERNPVEVSAGGGLTFGEQIRWEALKRQEVAKLINLCQASLMPARVVQRQNGSMVRIKQESDSLLGLTNKQIEVSAGGGLTFGGQFLSRADVDIYYKK